MDQKYQPTQQLPIIEQQQQQEQKTHSPLKGILLSILGGIFLHISKLFSKLAIINSPEGVITTFHINSIRSGTLVVVCLFLQICIKVDFHDIPKASRVHLLIRCLAGLSATLAMYGAMQIVPYSQIQILCYLSPIFLVFLAWYFLNQKITAFDIIALFFALFGLVIYVNPGHFISSTDRSKDFKHGEDANSILGIGLGLWASLAACAVMITFRKMKDSIHPTAVAFYYGLSGAILLPGFVFVLDSKHEPKGEFMSLLSFFLLGFCGVSFSIGTQILTYAFRFEKAARLSMFGYLEAIYGFIFDVTIFGSVLRWNDYVAAVLILGSALGISVLKYFGKIK